MALTRNIITKIDERTKEHPQMRKDLKRLLNSCEEGRQLKRVVEDILKKI